MLGRAKTDEQAKGSLDTKSSDEARPTHIGIISTSGSQLCLFIVALLLRRAGKLTSTDFLPGFAILGIFHDHKPLRLKGSSAETMHVFYFSSLAENLLPRRLLM